MGRPAWCFYSSIHRLHPDTGVSEFLWKLLLLLCSLDAPSYAAPSSSFTWKSAGRVHILWVNGGGEAELAGDGYRKRMTITRSDLRYLYQSKVHKSTKRHELLPERRGSSHLLGHGKEGMQRQGLPSYPFHSSASSLLIDEQNAQFSSHVQRTTAHRPISHAVLVVVETVCPILLGSSRTAASPAPGGGNQVALLVVVLLDLGGGEVRGKVRSTEGEGSEPLLQGFRLGVGGVRVRVGIHG
ncbi:hypothetical protein GUJ93_ZPchr0006g43107 [Zizania palustris]|uniref:Uncharacterized protein n=1 Tax=Zizania palustris TaxID=103762 RepID=A0A8J5W4C2_ZIZPA|nr:hypothetical protein GUJ93_ZPchr0006g43107 [Zizania palustris]